MARRVLQDAVDHLRHVVQLPLQLLPPPADAACRGWPPAYGTMCPNAMPEGVAVAMTLQRKMTRGFTVDTRIPRRTCVQNHAVQLLQNLCDPELKVTRSSSTRYLLPVSSAHEAAARPVCCSAQD